uniref:Uncharacterized protein n=1 Tax=Oryza meridionalis TaxID=40149 RepID=A0A0E0EL42_9ORYZ
MRCQQTAASFSATSPFISDSNRVRCISPSSTVQHAASCSPEELIMKMIGVLQEEFSFCKCEDLFQKNGRNNLNHLKQLVFPESKWINVHEEYENK